jgi:2-aminoethylphosphonate-pyruvate transaminase
LTDTRTSIQALTDTRNDAKLLFTAGPASLLPENLTGLRPCFGRGDEDYTQVENAVLDALLDMSGHARIARMQGSASLALEIAALNFLYGRVLVVSTGYYSDRLQWLAESGMRRDGHVSEVVPVHWTGLADVAGKFDWIWACSTETSCGLRLPIDFLAKTASRLGARLMLDATASIGLENGHELADVITYSSCKGLFGLTGASFIAFNDMPAHEADSFYLNLRTHLDKRMTGPYHALASLADVLPRHQEFRAAVVANKTRFLRDMQPHLSVAPENQPLLCTHVNCRISAADARAILYAPRSGTGGSVVCHLGEAHLGLNARGDILESLRIETETQEDGQ